MSYRFSYTLSKEEYDGFALTHPLYNIYQSSPWPEVKKEWHSMFTAVYEEEKIIAAGLVIYRDLPLKQTLFYLPKGPLIDFENEELLRFYFNELKKVAKKKHAIMIRIDPNVLLSSVPFVDIKNHEEVRQSKVIDRLKKIGFIHYGFNKDMYATSQPRYTACFYYKDGWLENYRTKATRSIRKAEKKGITLEVIGPDKLPEFSKIMSYTEKRKNVALRNQEYYQRLCDAYQDNVYMVLSKLDIRKQLEIKKKTVEEWQKTIDKKAIAEHKINQLKDQVASMSKDIEFEQQALQEDGDVVYISCLLGVKVGDTCELLYAGMNDKYRRYLATYVSYFSGIRWAYEQGCRQCNFGGIEGTLDDGLTEFKGYFEPNIDEYIGEFDMKLNGLMYWGFTKGVPMYKAVRRYLRGKKK